MPSQFAMCNINPIFPLFFCLFQYLLSLTFLGFLPLLHICSRHSFLLQGFVHIPSLRITYILRHSFNVLDDMFGSRLFGATVAAFYVLRGVEAKCVSVPARTGVGRGSGPYDDKSMHTMVRATLAFIAFSAVAILTSL